MPPVHACADSPHVPASGVIMHTDARAHVCDLALRRRGNFAEAPTAHNSPSPLVGARLTLKNCPNSILGGDVSYAELVACTNSFFFRDEITEMHEK